ncbi:juvenile hormone esterase-like isoform X2 [Symsagittifera roscoffensis]|uniref:juvenile hormone esterase-like isoform X2 n=1 Tax=Symsagittifera roscoffensis TaxID=84072 RepID=UPI00307CAF24
MSAAMIVKTIKSQEKGGGSRENVSAPIGGSGGRVTTKWYDTKRGCVSIEVFIILLLIGVLYACHFMAIRYMPPTPPLQYVNVTTPCGVYIGIQQHNMYTFKGIRYAVLKAGLANNESAQPVWGNAAWCNPHDVHKSLNFGKPCLQMLRTVAEDGFATDQEILYGCKDCLFSNIFVPSNILNINTSGTGVIVYVHGGEMRQGSGHQEDIVPLSAIAARFVQDMGVLLVTFNYRLILHQSQGPIKQAHDVLSGSGVADQIELLRWVNKMIPYFGGNKDNVTLLVHDHKDSLIHQIEEKAGGSLFTRAIVLSPIITETSDYPISTTSDRTATRELSRTNDHEQFGSNCSQETCEWKPRGSLESHCCRDNLWTTVCLPSCVWDAWICPLSTDSSKTSSATNRVCRTAHMWPSWL